MVSLARLIRWAMVGSGTRNAWEISAVVKPPTARNVSAIAEARGQRGMAAHEEKDQRVVFPRRSLDGRRFWRADRLVRHLAFATAASRFAANVVAHPPEGDLGQPCAGIVRSALAWPLHRGGKRRFLNGVLRRGEVAKSSDNGPEHPRRQFPQQVLYRNVHRLFHHCKSSGGPLITCRTSMGMLPGVPAGAGAAEARAAIRYACSGLSTSTIQ